MKTKQDSATNPLGFETSTIVDLDELFKPISSRISSTLDDPSTSESSQDVNKNQSFADKMFEAMNESDFVPSDSRTEYFTESIEASIGYSSLIRQLNESVRTRITFFLSKSGGSRSFDEARKAAFKECKDVDEAKKLFLLLQQLPTESISFYELARLWDKAPRVAERLWESVKAEGRKEFESGHLASKSTFPITKLKDAWETAKYLGIRESFVAEWNPKSGIEFSLIDMLTQTFLQWQYWYEQSVLQSHQYQESHDLYSGTPTAERYRPNEKMELRESLNHAVQMADRFNRIYLRTLRQLRDLRRYTPVTINNPGQVNIAGDGGQQLNVN